MTILPGRKLSLSIDLKIMHSIIEQHIAASPYVVGVELARQIDDYTREQQLGYYPALNYFQGNEAVDSDLYNTAESIAWLLESLAQQSLHKYLRPILDEFQIDSSHVQMFVLPHVRPNQSNAIHSLTAHLTPDHLRIALSAKLNFGATDEDALIHEVADEINRALEGHFSLHDIHGIKLIS